MNEKYKKEVPKTQHSKIYEPNSSEINQFVVIDNPDDRITRKTGDGTTLVKNDNPDDVEDKLTVK